jgi:hypothetical protein
MEPTTRGLVILKEMLCFRNRDFGVIAENPVPLTVQRRFLTGWRGGTDIAL